MIRAYVREKNLIHAGPAHLSESVGYPVPAIEQKDFGAGDHQQPGLRVVWIQRRPGGAQKAHKY